MLKKIIILVICLSAVLLALGEKPAGRDTGSDPVVNPRVLRQPIEELSADDLYQRAVAEHRSAQRMHYPEQTNLAIAAAALFVEKYNEDDRRFELMYYLALNYAKNNRFSERKSIVDDFFAQVPTDDESKKTLIELMRFELLPALVSSPEGAASANILYAELTEQYAGDRIALARLHQDALSALNTEKQKTVYLFFREGNNRNFLNNPVDFVIYAHRLGIIYFNENNYREARPLFREVAARTEPEYSLFAESAANYLRRMDGR